MRQNILKYLFRSQKSTKNRHFTVFTPRGTHNKWAGHIICRWVWWLKMVQEVIIDIDCTNYTDGNLIHDES